MIRAGALTLAASLLPLWAAGYIPADWPIRAALQPLALGLLAAAIVLLVLAVERPCQACATRAVLDRAALEHHYSERSSGLEESVLVVEPDADEPDEAPVVDDLDDGPAAVRVPAYAPDPWATVELPTIQ